jgi:general nucleoside transport system permease protein
MPNPSPLEPPPRSWPWRPLLPPLVAVLICMIVGVGALAALGFPPREVLDAVWNKVIWRQDSSLRLIAWANVLQYATPILLTGLAVTVAFRASVWNIGAQGQYLAGAIAGNVVGAFLSAPPSLTIPVLLLAAIAAGAAIALIAAILDWWRKVPVVLSTLLLNFIVIELLRYLIVGPLRDLGAIVRTRELLPSTQLPLIGEMRLQPGFFFALAAAAIVWFILRQTTFGFRLRVVGENPVAARFAGISVPRMSLATLAFSGALAGLAGGLEISGVRHELVFSDAESGYGFTGIAVALLGRLNPVGVILAALFFGLLRACFFALQIEAQVPSVTGLALQGLVIILMLVLTQPTAIRKWLAKS